MSKIFFSKIAQDKKWQTSLEHFSKDLEKAFGEKSCDVLIYFVSEGYKRFDPQIFCKQIHEASRARFSIGCNASGVVSDKVEVEMEPAISILAMHLPDVKIYPFHIPQDDSASIKTGTDLINFLDLYPTENPKFLCVADPGTCQIDQLLAAFNLGYKNAPVIGGLASGGVMGAATWLGLSGKVHTDGAVGLAFLGDIRFETLVSQGCRPVGKPFVITRADQNVLFELAGRPALEVTRDLLQSLPPKDKALSEHSLFVGLAMSEQKSDFKRGDFLIRNIMGFDPDSGALMVGATLRVGQTLQFQIRDAETSTEDLTHMLDLSSKTENTSTRGGILVTCCGRGQHLYGELGHDARLIQSLRGPLPLTGFFANGEIGPVSQKNYIHGYTSSLVIIS